MYADKQKATLIDTDDARQVHKETMHTDPKQVSAGRTRQHVFAWQVEAVATPLSRVLQGAVLTYQKGVCWCLCAELRYTFQQQIYQL
jgi:hypothetical protein